MRVERDVYGTITRVWWWNPYIHDGVLCYCARTLNKEENE